MATLLAAAPLQSQVLLLITKRFFFFFSLFIFPTSPPLPKESNDASV